MSKKSGSSKGQNNISYIAQKPSFLQNFGKPPAPPPDPSGREPLPERPRDGKWGRGSDDGDEADRREDGSDDEWGDVYGGGGEEGPQVVVLKEGRHLTAEEVKRERRRAAGKPSVSPPPVTKGATKDPANTKPKQPEAKPKPVISKVTSSSAKRKLVGGEKAEGDKMGEDGKGKKKKKAGKGMLSFDEAEGEA